MTGQSVSKCWRSAAVAIAFAAAACAAPTSAAVRHGSVIDASRNVTQTTERGLEVRLDVPRDSVWRALVAAYGDIGLVSEVADESTGVIRTGGVAMRGVYRGVRTSALFSCGQTPTGAERADAGKIVAIITTQIQPLGAETSVATMVDAVVIPDGGTSSGSLRCGSSGNIEDQIHKALAKRLGRRP